MRKLIVTLAYTGLIVFNPFLFSFGQKPLTTSGNPELMPMSSYDSLKLSQLPVLKLPDEATRRLLPYAVDNSGKPWFRPLIAQVGLECGQASSIGVVFTYEMNYARNVPGNLPENQYATHFAYNFVNNGGDAGVSFFETFEIVRQAGNPSVADYGGMSAGGATRWMDGYDLYYNAMHNRIDGVYSIRVNTIDGLQTLKNWIYDHGNGSSAGGLGCFYAEFTHPAAFLPEGTPEAGKHVIYAWGNSSNHAMSIVGYNDSIRWDYNNDGQYTNNIDINSDGLVDLRDWEIGGFKMANTYGSISGWGDNGFSYMMYKSVADQFQQGGIWNNTVVVPYVRDNHEPQLTAKVSLSYPCRDLLRVMAGVSSDPEATEPDHILHYPIFDFQGGCNPMQGSSGPQSIEFGLDLNLLLQYINPGEEAKFFILVQENDPLGSQTGTLESFALVDYTNGGAVINSQISELPLVNDNITMAGVNAIVNFDPVLVTTSDLPPVQIYSNYSSTLQAEGGTPPYRWNLVEDYTRFDSTSVMPQITSQLLQLSSNSNGKAKVELPFTFPYFGQNYSEVYATSDGYLMFENSLLPWPYYIEGRTYFIQTPMIAPSMSNPFLVDAGQGDGVWYEESDSYVTFRWKLSVSGSSGSTFNATARLYQNGRIEINYGNCSVPSYIERYAGISAGDGENYEILTYDPDFSSSPDQLVRYTPTTIHPGISLSSDGLLTGETSEIFTNLPITVCVTDKNNMKNCKTLFLNTEGLMMEYEILAGDDEIIGFGEEGFLTLHITNLNSFALGATIFTLNSFDPYFELLVNQAAMNGILPGETITIENAFRFMTSELVPDAHNASFILNGSSSEGNWTRALTLTAWRAMTEIAGAVVIDGNNGILEPGETAQLAINLRNEGGADLTNAVAAISSWDPYLTITAGSGSTDTLKPGEIWPLVFEVSLAPETPLYHLIEINLEVTGDHQFSYFKTIPFFTGILVENFENGNFTTFDWEIGGDAPWAPEEGSAYEGNWCARSGIITDNQLSTFSINWNVAFADSVSFWFRVSSEPGYDYLHFFTKDGEIAKWAGDWNWTRANFAVSAGEHPFAWKYIKDYSVSTGEDCSRLDYIVLPVFAVPTPAGKIISIPAKLSVYPNPGHDMMRIDYSLDEPSAVQVSVCDMHGRVLFIFEDKNILPIGEYSLTPDLSILESGVYNVILRTSDGILVKKIVRIGD
ncbi:MAG: T9SS type A sorting domain-containing protein [Bacteroidales bacterium]|nr:T9SS type A sorting domain-containing protein [Bacteroidales bacterium]